MSLNIGKKLKKLRTQKGYTLKQLSNLSKISISFISDIENGRRNPSIETLQSIAIALDVPINEFFQNGLFPEVNNVFIGKIIKDLRSKNKITQEILAKNIGVSTSMVGMYETNARKPSYEVLLKIADYFNVSTDYLLGKTNYKNIWEEFDDNIDIKQLKKDVKTIEDADKILKSTGTDISTLANNNLSEQDILTMAAHKVGHDGKLSPEEMDKIKLAIKIALSQK